MLAWKAKLLMTAEKAMIVFDTAPVRLERSGLFEQGYGVMKRGVLTEKSMVKRIYAITPGVIHATATVGMCGTWPKLSFRRHQQHRPMM